MSHLRRIRITIDEPFSGGALKIREGGKQVLPNIYLPQLKPPDYEAVDQDIVRYLASHRQKGTLKIEYGEDDLPQVDINDVSFLVEGEPKESVRVELLVK